MKDKLKQITEPSTASVTAKLEPLPGHAERFEIRLLQKQEQTKSGKTVPMWWIGMAAAMVIGVIVAVAVNAIQKADDLMAMNRVEASEEVMAMDSVFHSKVGTRLPVVEGNDAYSQRILSEVARLEDEYKKMEVNLIKGADPDRITDEMVKNYQFRIRLIEQLRQYLIIKQQQHNHEKIS
jgi:hypothetical protein